MRGPRGGGWGWMCSVGTELLSCKMNRAVGVDGGDGHTRLGMCLRHLECYSLK